MPKHFNQIVSLTSFQKELWLAHQALPEKHPGISCGGQFFLDGVPDPDLLIKALRLAAKHFPLLTATLEDQGGAFPVFHQGVHPEPEFEFKDLADTPGPEAAAQTYFDQFREKPFQALGGPLARFALLRLGPDRAWFLSHFIHLVKDGVAAMVHFRLMALIYSDLQAGRIPALGEPYDWGIDLAADENHLASERYTYDVAYWEEYLQNLPVERVFTPRLGHPDTIDKIERLELDLSMESTRELQALAEQHNANMSQVFIGLHTILMARLYDKNHLSVQVPLRFGERKDILKLTGHRVNIAPLIVYIENDDTFPDVLKNLSAGLRSHSRHAPTPFQHGFRKNEGQYQREILWDTNVNYIPMLPTERFGQIRVTRFGPVTSQYDPVLLGIYLMEGMDGGGSHLSIDFSTNHFSREDVENYVLRLESLAHQILTQPDQSVRVLNVLLDSELKELKVWENGRHRRYPHQTITEAFEYAAEKVGDKSAVVGADGWTQSYTELKSRINSIAQWLIQKGIQPGQVVGVLTRRNPRLPETILGILKTGAIYLPVDADYPSQRIRHILKDAGARLVIVLEPDSKGSFSKEMRRLKIPTRLPAGTPDVTIHPDDPAYMIYTSGTTGQPKGVVVSHRAFMNTIHGQIEAFDINPSDRMLQFASPAFDAALSEIFMPLLSGATLYPVNRELIDEPWQLVDYINKHGVTGATFPPSYLRLLDRAEMPQLRLIISAGETPVLSDARHYAKHLDFINGYGPTEAAVCATYHRTDSQSGEPYIPIGKPLPNTQAYILNTQAERVAPGIPGELYLGGSSLAMQYHNRPELTRERFIRTPFFKSNKRLYRTGDRAVWTSTGEIVILGRTDNQVKLRGHRIELEEVDAVLMRHPAVRQAASVVTANLSGQTRLTAFIALQNDNDLTDVELVGWLKTQLPDYMLPGSYVRLESLPLTPAGKADRRLLTQQVAQLEKNAILGASDDNLSHIESDVRDCFMKILGIAAVDANADFFTLGGDSLKAIETVKLLAREYDYTLSVRDFMANPTVTAVAIAISRNEPTRSDSAVDLEYLPLSQAQSDLWVQTCLNEPGPRYNMPLAFDLTADEAQIDRFMAAFSQAVEAQPLCRAWVSGDIDAPVFKLEPQSKFRISRKDLSTKPVPETAAQPLFDEFIHRPFDLTQHPLVRGLMLRLAPESWRLVVVMHHIIGDGESLNILLRNALRILGGETQSAIPARLLTEFVENEQRYLDTVTARDDLTFWKEQLLPLPRRTDLLPKRTLKVKTGRGNIVRQTLNDVTVKALERLTTQHLVSSLAVFISLVNRFLQIQTNAEESAVSVPVGLRDDPKLFEVAGYFVNTIILREQSTARLDLAESISQTNTRLKQAIRHSRFPFGKLPAELGEVRDPSRGPLVDILVTTIDDRQMVKGLDLPPNFDIRPAPVSLRASKLDFSFLLYTHLDGGAEVVLEYDSDLAEFEQAQAILEKFSAFLDDMLQSPVTETQPASSSVNSDLIAKAWQQTLGGALPEPKDNFFVHGGDSIKAIQMVGHLRRWGFTGLKPADIFEFPVFEELCDHLGESGIESVQSRFTRSKPGDRLNLTPMQSWLFREHGEHWKKFFMVMPLRLGAEVNLEQLRTGIERLPQRHEVFRLAFKDATVHLLTKPVQPIWESLKPEPSAGLQAAFAQAAQKLFDQIQPAAGRLFGSVQFSLDDKQYLLVGGHHLILDVVSLEILRQELDYYQTHGFWPPGESPVGAVTWAQTLAEQHGRLLNEHGKAFWNKILSQSTGDLSAIKTGIADRAGDRFSVRRTVEMAFAADDTTDRRSVLLAALGQALTLQGQTVPVRIALEGHGRTNELNTVDISQSVGWFTSVYPGVINPGTNFNDTLSVWQEFFRELPQSGLSFGLLRDDEGEPLKLEAPIALNYLGQIQAQATSEGLEILPEFIAPGVLPGLIDENYRFDSPLDLVAYTSGTGELVLEAYFSPKCLDENWTRGLLDDWGRVLEKASQPNSETTALANQCGCDISDIEWLGKPDLTQQGMLFQYVLDEAASQTYTQQINFRLSGDLDANTLVQAWRFILQRHESLRSLFPVGTDGEFRRVILKNARTAVDQIDLSAYLSKKQIQRRDAILQQQREMTFDLARGPLFTLQLFSYAPDDHEMSWCFHHVLMDGWCIGILLRDIFTAYVAFSQGRPPNLPAPSSIRMYQSWREKWGEQAAEKYWRELLADFRAPTMLRPEVSGESEEDGFDEMTFRLDVTNTHALQTITGKYSVTLPIFLQALWGILLGVRNQNRRDAVYGLVSSGRPADVAGMDEMVGLFIQTVPVRTTWESDDRFADLLERVKVQSIHRSEYEYLHLADIQRLAQFEGPLFDNILVFENYPLDGIVRSGAPQIRDVTGVEQHPYAIGLSIIPGDELTFRFSYRTAAFDSEAIAELWQQWLELVTVAADNGEMSCGELEEVLQTVVVTTSKPETPAYPTAIREFNQTQRPYPRESSIADIFQTVCKRRSKEKALIGSTGESWTYQRLNDVSDTIASALPDLHPGEPVAFGLAREPEAIAVILGILKAGGCYLPLDSKNPPERNLTMLRIAACDKVILSPSQHQWFEPTATGTLNLYYYNDLIQGPPVQKSKTPEIGGKHPAYIMFTSGSTGEPKGVVVPQRAVLRLVLNNHFWEIVPGERILQAGPLGFDASTLEIWGPLLNGGTVCFISDDQLLSPNGLERKIQSERVAQMWLTAGLSNIFAEEKPHVFRNLRRLFTGGEALSITHIRNIAQACPQLEIFNGYGPTENTTFTTVHRITTADLERASIPIGRPIANTRVHIISEDGTLAEVGEWGEICAAGDGLALGYVGREDLTRELFVDLPEPVGERVYRTGDLGRWLPEGVIEFGGRRDNQIKLRGYRIELSEIEQTIFEVPEVNQAAVVAVPDDIEVQILAYVCAGTKNASAIKNALEARLPVYMIPQRIIFLPQMPLNKNGKIDRQALMALARAETSSAISVIKSGSLEATLAEIFKELLGVTVQKPDAHFFKLGGQSLKALVLLNRIHQTTGADLRLRELMRQPTIAGLAALIRTQLTEKKLPTLDVTPQMTEQPDYALSTGQERIWFLQRLHPESTVYSIPFAILLRGEVNQEALEQAFQFLEQRHEALRLRMPTEMGAGKILRQKIADPGSLKMDYLDFSHDSAPEVSIQKAIEAELTHPFRFGYEEPLIRVRLYRETPDATVLFINLHHIIFDGWSGEILIRDLLTAYKAAVQKQTPEWQPLAQRFVDYAAAQRQFITSDESAELKDRWLERMTPLPEPLKLPTDNSRPVSQTFQGSVHEVVWKPDLTGRLKNYANQQGITLFALQLALVKTFLLRHTSQTDITVGVPVAGRTRPELAEVVGFFVNTVPVRTQIDPQENFTTLAQQVHADLQTALADQDFPLEALVNSLDLPRDASRNPLFDVLVAQEQQTWFDLALGKNLQAERYPLHLKNSKVDLSFYFRETPDGMLVQIEFNTDLFKLETIERMAERLGVLAENATAQPETVLSHLPVMSESERGQVLHGFNATVEELGDIVPLDDIFLNQVQRTPDAIALENSTGTRLTYSEFSARVKALATHLQSQGVEEGTYIGVSFDRSVELMTAIYAVLRLGAIYVPIPPGLPVRRMATMLEDLPNAVILTSPEHVEKFGQFGHLVLTPKMGEGDFKKPSLSPNNPAYVIFTSGSTGRPKGVLVEQPGVVNRVRWMQSRFPLTAQDVILQKTPISFDVSIWELFWWSWTGATLALLEPNGEKDPAAMVAAIERHTVTVMHFVPSMLRMFLDFVTQHPDAVSRIGSLRYVFVSGEALAPETVRKFNQLIASANGTELHNLYGPTEATVDVTWQPCTPDQNLITVPIGKPISNTRIYILNEQYEPVPIGVTGEIYISGIQVARGYLNRPDLTSERFLPDPFVAGNRMYRTGDLGVWRETGQIEYLGRQDNQVKVRGFRIELDEVENALAGLKMVSQAVVLVSQVGGIASLEAYIVPVNDAVFDVNGLQRQTREILPEYMVPTVFYQLDQIPLTTSGKADRRALHQLKLTPVTSQPVSHEITHSAIETKLLDIWSEVLAGVNNIGVDQNFFQLGGNSLLLIRLHELLEQEWPQVFSLAELFVAVTIRQQARRIEGDQKEATTPVAVTSGETSPRLPVNNHAIAVIGMALRLGDYEEPGDLWSDLVAGVDRTRPLSGRRRQETIQLMSALGINLSSDQLVEAAFLEDISAFDCRRFGLAPADVQLMDPEQRLFLETAFRSLEDAGYGGNALDGRKVGIFAGASVTQTFKEATMRSFPEQVEQSYILNVPSNLATRIGYLKNWSGPAELVDTACSSSLKAIRDACQSLERGESELAVAGGVRVLLSPYRSEQSFAIETSIGQTRTFDAQADGVGNGEGALVFLLKPLAQAQQDGDAIHAVILGGAVNQDGRSASAAAPNPVAQSQVIQAAARDAGVALADLDFFEAHGTATALGDPIEIDGLTRAFGDSQNGQKAWIGSVKGNFGHLDAGAGALGFAKAVLSLKNGAVPRQPHFERPNPKIDFERAPVQVAARIQTLNKTGTPWRCGVSAFGLSGINAHLILQQAPEKFYPPDDGTWQVVVLSAASPNGLRTYADKILQTCAGAPEWPLHAVAATLAMGREHLPYRLALPARNLQEFQSTLTDWCLNDHLPEKVKKSNPDLDCQVIGLANEGAARAAAKAFLQGAEPTWPLDRPIFRVHLPAVPMDRTVCWPDFKPLLLADQMQLLGQMMDSPEGKLFPIPVADTTFWPMAEHQLKGQPTLVGMGLVALLAEVLERLELSQTHTIKSLNWLQPLMLNQVVPDSVALLVVKTDPGLKATFRGRTVTGEWTVFAEARLQPGSFTGKTIDLTQLKRDLSKVSGSDGNQENSAVSVSERWNCLQRKWRSADGNTVLAALQLPEKYQSDLKTITCHPALMDVAVGLTLEQSGLVPATCGGITLYHPIPATLYSLVTRKSDTESRSGAVQVNCQLVGVDGQVLAELNDLIFMPVKQPQPRLHRLEWHHQPLVDDDYKQQLIDTEILILGQRTRPDALVKMMEDRGQPFQYQPIPDNFSERMALPAAILEGQTTHIVYIIPEKAHSAWDFAEFMQALCKPGLRQPLHLLAVNSAVETISTSSPTAAIEMGLLRALSQEEPNLRSRYLEITGENPAAILAELTNLTVSSVVPVRIDTDGKRLVRGISDALHVPTGATLEKIDGALVITGGLGAMALTLARPLAEKLDCGLALMHQGEFPPESEWERLKDSDDAKLAFRASKLMELQKAGIDFSLYSCDVSQKDDLAQTLNRIRSEMREIQGIFHTAGVPGGGFLLNKSQAAYETVLAPKVEGTRYLHELTQTDHLKYFVLFSSRTALTGAPGQTDYTAANAYLDAFAHWRQEQELPALSLDWNTWNTVGMAARSGSLDLTVPSLNPEQAMSVLEQALLSGESQVVVSMPGERLEFDQSVLKSSLPEASTADETIPLDERILQLIARSLGYETPLSYDDDFYALGGDSITGMQIVNRLNQEYNLDVTLADLFSNSQLGGFIQAIGATKAPEQPASSPELIVPVLDAYPVTWEQLSVLQAEVTTIPHTGFNLPQFIQLPKDVDLQRLEQALNRLVERHEILRTRFQNLDSPEPKMEILPPKPVSLLRQTISKLDSETVKALVVPFDLTTSPLFRTALLEKEPADRILFFDIHHSLADARTVDILMSDLYALYQGHSLPELQLQLKDAAWLLHQDDPSRMKTARQYWLGKFQGELPLVDFPADRLRPVQHTFRGATTHFDIPPELILAVHQTAREHGTTTNNFMLSVWALLLARYARTDDLVMAVGADNRSREIFSQVPGMFVSLLPLRLKIDDTESFTDFLKRNHRLNIEALENRSFTLNRLLTELHPPLHPDRTPLMEVSFSYMNFDSVKEEPEAFKPLNVSNPSCKSDIAIFGTDFRDHLSFTIEYYADLFEPVRMERMSRHFLTLLHQILEKGTQLKLASYNLIEEAERQLIESFEDGSPGAFPDRSLDSLIWIYAANQGEKPVWVKPNAEGLTWRELDYESRLIATNLYHHGISTGDTLHLALENNANLPLYMLGCARAGVRCVLSEPALLHPEARWLISDTEPKAHYHSLTHIDSGVLLQGGTEQMVFNLPDISPSEPVFSVSTDHGDWVDLNQETLHSLARQMQECGIEPGSRVLITAHPATPVGLVQLWGALLAGATLVVDTHFRAIEPFKSISQMPELAADILLAEADQLVRPNAKVTQPLNRFKRLIMLGEEIPDAGHMEKWRKFCPELEIVTGLRIPGSVLLMTISRSDDAVSEFLQAGRPIALNRIAIKNEDSSDTPIGIWGKLHLGGTLADGGAGSWEHTWRPTNIICRWREDGIIELRGMVSDSDPYTALLRSAILEMESVEQAQVNKNVAGGWHASVIASSSFDPEATRKALRRLLPVHLSKFSIDQVESSSGKKGNGPSDQPGSKTVNRNQLESIVLKLFKQYFNDDAITLEDSFFDLGGHSLLALQIVNQVAKQTGRELTIRDLFENPTPLEMSQLLADTPIMNGPISRALSHTKHRFPMSHAQQRLYVLHYTDTGAQAYNFSFVYQIEGEFDTDRFKRALDRLCQRHEILRTAFSEEESQLWQVVAEEIPTPLTISDFDEADNETAVESCRQDAVKPFDLHQAPLFHFRLCRFNEHKFLLSLVMHHIIGDGWSMQVLFGELLTLYHDDSQTESSLSPLEIQYSDYAVWQQNRDWHEEATYWKSALLGAPNRIQLPADGTQSARNKIASTVKRMIPEELLTQLRQYASHKRVSLATLMLTFFTSLLYRLTRQTDMVIGMGVAGRERAELEGLIGFFINILPIRVKIDDETGFDDLLDLVHRTSLEALARQDFPYDLLVREISPDRKAHSEALINVMFEYQRYSDLAEINRAEAFAGNFKVTNVEMETIQSANGESSAPLARYDLTLFIQDEPNGCRMKAEFDASLLSPQTVSDWLSHLQNFMTMIMEAESQVDA